MNKVKILTIRKNENLTIKFLDKISALKVKSCLKKHFMTFHNKM